MKSIAVSASVLACVILACSGANPQEVLLDPPANNTHPDYPDAATPINQVDSAPSCVAETNAEFCARTNSQCNVFNAVDNNCGVMQSVVNCGMCVGASNCVNGKCVVAACVPETDAQLCAGKDCGALPAVVDKCGVSRTPVCGPVCGKKFLCTNNKCTACVPKTCKDLVFTCGAADDSCNPAPLNCGVCSADTVCTNNICVCAAPKHTCANACVANDDKACGPGCINCKPDVPHVKPVCLNDVCDYKSACDPGYADCVPDQIGMPPNGCETNIQTASTHCGGCNIVCAIPKTCQAGLCK